VTDPLEEQLRDHFAERAARVTAEPDPGAFVERSTGRTRPGAGLIAGLVAVVAVLAGGGFVTGMSVAGSSPAAAPVPRTGSGASAAAGGAMVPAGTSPAVGTPATALATPMTWLFTRTTSAGVTVRAFLSGESVDPCPPSLACAQPVVVPAPVTCPTGALCAQPVTVPATVPAGVTGTAGGTAVPGSDGGSSGSSGGSPGTTVTDPTPTPSHGCTELTVELSTDRAVSTSVGPGPSGVAPSGSVAISDSGSFGSAEGGPAVWVAAEVGAGVASVRLVSATGSVLDAMAPTHGVVVLATSGSDTLTGASLVVLDAAGTTTATVPADQQSGTPRCATVVPGGPATPSTTTTTLPGSPPTTSTTGPVPPAGVPATPTGTVGSAGDGG